MTTLIIMVIAGLGIGYFATQNTAPIVLRFADYTTPGIPAYFAIVGALLIGLFLSWIISMIHDVSTGMSLHGKEAKIKNIAQENAELLKKNHQLELEVTRLKAEYHVDSDEKSL